MIALQLMNEFRNSRHLTTDTSYQCCGAAKKNDVHTIHDCPRDMSIWLSLYIYHPSDFYMHDCKTLFKHNTTTAI